MPRTIKIQQIAIKDPDTGTYSGVDVLSEQTEQGLIAELQAEGTTQVNRINQAAVDVQSAVDKAETDAAKIISDTQASVNTLESQKNTIAATVASMAELGTDVTLSTPGMAADAAAVGDLSRQLSDVEEAALALKYTSTKIVPNGTDFDTLTVPGNYRVSSAGNMQTMIHSPIAVAGRVEVLSLTYNDTIFQIVTSATASPTVWIRPIYKGTAGDWQKLNIIDEVAKTQGTIITANNYTSYFTSFNDVPPNTIYTIRENTPISDGPVGHANISSVEATGGYAGGILITYEGGKTGNLITRGQIFITYTNTIPQGIIAFRMARYDSASSSIIWGEWGKIGDRTALSATNTIIHSSMVQAGVAPFTDLNDAPNNSMYQLDLDLTAEDMANNPLTGHSAVLYTFNFSYISRHATVQMCFGLNNGMVGYIRYGYLENGLKWTPWRQITTDIPAAPNQNGTYTLRCTVQNGTKEYAWIAV